jgi:hypothetical protein
MPKGVWTDVARLNHHNKRKTHCPRNHPYDQANTLIWFDHGVPVRSCRACNRERAKKNYIPRHKAKNDQAFRDYVMTWRAYR